MRNNKIGWKADRRALLRDVKRQEVRARRRGDTRTPIVVGARHLSREL